jgi:hypothetical protein
LGDCPACGDSILSAAHEQPYDFDAFEHDWSADANHHQGGRTKPSNTNYAFDSADAAVHSAECDYDDHACASSGNATGRHDTDKYSRIHNYSSSLRDRHYSEWILLDESGSAFWIDYRKQHQSNVEFANSVRHGSCCAMRSGTDAEHDTFPSVARKNDMIT